MNEWKNKHVVLDEPREASWTELEGSGVLKLIGSEGIFLLGRKQCGLQSATHKG